jgi:hypothetical protein
MTKPVRPNKNQHIVGLAEELVEDIERDRLSAERIVYKANRLARAVDDADTLEWLSFELNGYNADDERAIHCLRITGRYLSEDRKNGYFASIGGLEADIKCCQRELEVLRVPDVDYHQTEPDPCEQQAWGDSFRFYDPRARFDPCDPRTGLSRGHPRNILQDILSESTQKSECLCSLETLRSRVIALVHAFAQRVYYEKLFSGLAETIFERYKSEVDALLAATCGEVLKKLPAVYDRLSEGDTEAISHALTTCRRVLESFADAVNPPSDRRIKVDGKAIVLNKQNWRARVREHLNNHFASKSRRERLRHMLDDLANRTGTGVHDDIAPDEAKALLLHTYLFVGEISTLVESPRSVQST